MRKILEEQKRFDKNIKIRYTCNIRYEKNNLNRKSLPRMVRLIINKDKTDSYIVRVNIIIFSKRQTNILIDEVFIAILKVCF